MIKFLLILSFSIVLLNAEQKITYDENYNMYQVINEFNKVQPFSNNNMSIFKYHLEENYLIVSIRIKDTSKNIQKNIVKIQSYLKSISCKQLDNFKFFIDQNINTIYYIYDDSFIKILDVPIIFTNCKK